MSKGSSKTAPPRLVVNDPWLEPYRGKIEGRLSRYHKKLEEIREGEYGTLASYANGYEILGIHRQKDGTWVVREWLPGALQVHFIGDFNDWNRSTHPMKRGKNGLWSLTLPKGSLQHEQRCKLHVIGANGFARDRLFSCTRRAIQDHSSNDFATQIWEPDVDYEWQHEFDPATITMPLIYEAHIGMAGEEPRIHSYAEFTRDVLPRIAAQGYNAIQLMAIQEHPYYGSFGYHVSNFFAPSSRFGTPEELKELIDTAHGMGIAVLLDLVHSHSIKNIAEGLNDLDGTGNLYFHADARGEHPQWDSKCFDYGRPEVRRFLLSNVRYWMEEFRFDGFRFDGITSLLYWHRGMASFDHYDRYFDDAVDEDAVFYLQLATTLAKQIQPGVLLIAEDMSGMPGLCRPTEEGGLGFTHRLAMGIPDYWIKLLKHVRDEDWNLDEMWHTLLNRRSGEAHIAYAESHDQALVGDKTLAFRLMDQEMYWHMSKGDRHPVIDRGLALHKMIRLITFALGGEGWLNFIGNEFGHPEWIDFPREGNGWSYHYCRRQWSLVDNPDLHYQELNAFDAALMEFGKQYNLPGNSYVRCLNIDHKNKVLCFERGGLIFVFNWSPEQSIPDYKFAIPYQGDFEIALDTDALCFGGYQRNNPETRFHVGSDSLLHIYTPARTALVFKKIKS